MATVSGIDLAAGPGSRPARAGGSRNEWLLVAFTVVTNLCDAVTKIALPVLALRLTGSPGPVAVVTALLTLPWLVAALPVGVLVDRLDRRRLMLAAEAARLAAVAGLAALVGAGAAALAAVYAAALVLGVAEVVALTATVSIVPAAVSRDRWQVAGSRITAMEYLCNGFLGAPLGGLLVASGLVLALGVTGAAYLVGMGLLLLIAGRFAPGRDREHAPVLVEIRAGLGFLWHDRLLRTMALLVAGMAAAWSAWLAIIPAYALGPLRLDERGLGLLFTALGAGGVLGALLVGTVNRLLGRRWSMFVDIAGSFLLVAVPVGVGLGEPSGPAGAVWVGAAAFVAGVGGTMWTVNSRVLMASLVPAGMLGRLNAAYRLVSWGAAPAAAALAGVLAQYAGYAAAFGLFAALCLALVVPFLRSVTPAALVDADRRAGIIPE